MSLNRIELIGRLGEKPELQQTSSGAVAKFSVATSKKWRDDKGTQHEKTMWHNISAWGKHAENCAQYLEKGQQVYVDGEIEYRRYEKEGVSHLAVGITASRVIFLDKPTKKQNEKFDDNAAFGGHDYNSTGIKGMESNLDIPF